MNVLYMTIGDPKLLVCVMSLVCVRSGAYYVLT